MSKAACDCDPDARWLCYEYQREQKEVGIKDILPCVHSGVEECLHELTYNHTPQVIFGYLSRIYAIQGIDFYVYVDGDRDLEIAINRRLVSERKRQTIRRTWDKAVPTMGKHSSSGSEESEDIRDDPVVKHFESQTGPVPM